MPRKNERAKLVGAIVSRGVAKIIANVLVLVLHAPICVNVQVVRIVLDTMLHVVCIELA